MLSPAAQPILLELVAAGRELTDGLLELEPPPEDAEGFEAMVTTLRQGTVLFDELAAAAAAGSAEDVQGIVDEISEIGATLETPPGLEACSTAS